MSDDSQPETFLGMPFVTTVKRPLDGNAGGEVFFKVDPQFRGLHTDDTLVIVERGTISAEDFVRWCNSTLSPDAKR